MLLIDNERIRKWLCDIKILFSNPIEMQHKRHSSANNGIKRFNKMGDGTMQKVFKREDPCVLP